MSLRTKYTRKCENPKRPRKSGRKIKRERKKNLKLKTNHSKLHRKLKVGVQILDDAFVKMEKIEFIAMYSVGSLVKYRAEHKDKFPFK